jgi:hypothetical protein
LDVSDGCSLSLNIILIVLSPTKPLTSRCHLISHPTGPLTPPPMYRERPTLTWGYVQTRERRDKRCPQYRVLGSLRFRKDSEFGSLKSWQPPPFTCSPAQWIHGLLMLCWGTFCPEGSYTQSLSVSRTISILLIVLQAIQWPKSALLQSPHCFL